MLPGQKVAEDPDRLFGLWRARGHPQEAAGDHPELIHAQPRQRGFGPLLGVQRALAVLRAGRVVDVLRTVVVIQNLFPLGEVCPEHVPDPVGPVGDQGDPHAGARNPRGEAADGRRQLGFVGDLVPAGEVDHAMVLAQEIEAHPFRFAPTPRAAFLPAPAGRPRRGHGAVARHHQHGAPPGPRPRVLDSSANLRRIGKDAIERRRLTDRV